MFSIRRIFIPVDFSQHSVAAASYGAVFARHLSAKVILAHVVPTLMSLPYAFPLATPDVEVAQSQLAEAELRKLSADVFGTTETEIVVTIGDSYAELLRLTDDHKADFIVMGTQGRRNLGRWFLGSITERMLRKVHVPIMTVAHPAVRGHAEEKPAVASGRISHILYATDLSDDSVAAATFAMDLARVFKSRITVLHVLEYQDYILWGGTLVQLREADRTTIVSDTKSRMNELAKRANPAGLQVETAVDDGKPYQVILRYAEDHDIDLIVLNLQGKSLMERAALGSTAERVVRLANVPVLSVPIAEVKRTS
jgi:nucleotide-binding universal stress UspA family protein